MENKLLAVSYIFLLFSVVLFSTDSFVRGNKLDACKREHNVYACEFIATPVEKLPNE